MEQLFLTKSWVKLSKLKSVLTCFSCNLTEWYLSLRYTIYQACPGENNHMSCQGGMQNCPDLKISLLWARIARPPKLRTMPQNWQLIPSSIHYVSSKGLKQNDSSWTENLGADVCWLCKHCVALYCAVQAVREDCALFTVLSLATSVQTDKISFRTNSSPNSFSRIGHNSTQNIFTRGLSQSL